MSIGIFSTIQSVLFECLVESCQSDLHGSEGWIKGHAGNPKAGTKSGQVIWVEDVQELENVESGHFGIIPMVPNHVSTGSGLPAGSTAEIPTFVKVRADRRREMPFRVWIPLESLTLRC